MTGMGRFIKSSRFSVQVALFVLAFTWVAPKGRAASKVDPSQPLVKLEGWGTSLAWEANVVYGSSFVKAQLNSSGQEQYMKYLFDPAQGLGLTVLRYNIGGGENPSHTHMIEKRPAAQMEGYRDGLYSSYNWGRDASQRRMLVRGKQIVEAAGGKPIFEAFSNSPPYWMTYSACASGATSGGNDNLRSDMYVAFADYLTEVVKHFRDSWGIRFRTLEPLNEPYIDHWKAGGSQEGAHFGVASQNKILVEVAKSLNAKGLSSTTRLSGSDESNLDNFFNEWSGYGSSARSALMQINVHSYNYGSSRRYDLFKLAQANGKKLSMSEVGCCFTGTSDTYGMAGALTMAKTLRNDMLWLRPTTWSIWQADWGLLSIKGANPGDIKRHKQYYAMLQYMRFIRPGFEIIHTEENHTLAAFNASSKTLVLVADNSSGSNVDVKYDLAAFDELPSSASVYRSSEAENFSSLSKASVVNSQLSFRLAPRSISTLVLRGVSREGSSSGGSGDRVSSIRTRLDTSKCLDVPGWSKNNGTSLNIWSCGQNQANQTFHYVASTHELRVYNNTKCVDVWGAKAVNGARVAIYDCTGGKNQKWQITAAGELRSEANTSYCLDLWGAKTANGSTVGLWSCNGGQNQKWSFSP